MGVIRTTSAALCKACLTLHCTQKFRFKDLEQEQITTKKNALVDSEKQLGLGSQAAALSSLEQTEASAAICVD